MMDAAHFSGAGKGEEEEEVEEREREKKEEREVEEEVDLRQLGVGVKSQDSLESEIMSILDKKLVLLFCLVAKQRKIRF